ncbi:MAG: YchJ family metal-binding protein [Campylobacterota bacterium]|nr:YchJ family metal-binding protein [Campylobacterota bacterium]
MNKSIGNKSCICGVQKSYDECCQEIIEHRRNAQTPQELMRSRYSAYVKGNYKYLNFSTTQDNRVDNYEELVQESSSIEWLKLDVLNTSQNTVEFKAYYKEHSEVDVLHEKSSFIKEDGIWKYAQGEIYATKIQRNEICPCGSGKKYKKCCYIVSY